MARKIKVKGFGFFKVLGYITKALAVIQFVGELLEFIQEKSKEYFETDQNPEQVEQ